MATTTNYGWTTPDDTDLVKDGAAAIRTLGSSVDTTTKALNPSTTLGDIEYRSSTANTNTRLGIGTTGQVLTVAGGVPSWAALAAGGMTLINTGGTTLTGASVTISSIPSTYKNLFLIVRDFLPASDGQGLILRFNSDTNTRYAYGATVNASSVGFTESWITIIGGNDNSVANGLAATTIYDYANTDTWKLLSSDALSVNNTTTTNLNFLRLYGAYNQTAAITAITLLCETGNLTSGTAYLYGVN